MELPMPWFLASVAVRTAIVLVAVLLGLRLVGKRFVGGLNILDIVLVLLLGNAVQNAMTYGGGDLGVGLASAGTLMLVGVAMGMLFVRRPRWERTALGRPTIVVANGRLDRRAIRRESLDEDEVLAAVHDYGLRSLSEVRLAVLEADGTISIVPEEEKRP